MKRYKKLLIALAAIASLYLVKATGLDAGLIDAVLIDAVLDAAIEALAEAPVEVELPAGE
jgi:hypothetical protein